VPFLFLLVHQEFIVLPQPLHSFSADAERSATIRERVVTARAIARERFAGTPISAHADIPASRMNACCPLDENAPNLLAHASAKRQFFGAPITAGTTSLRPVKT
jgi:predicted ATPase with chaperone activity